MAQIVYQDRMYVVPDREMDGSELRKELNVPQGHDLLQVQDEGNLLIGQRRRVRPVDGDYFLDAPTFKYGLAPVA